MKTEGLKNNQHLRHLRAISIVMLACFSQFYGCKGKVYVKEAFFKDYKFKNKTGISPLSSSEFEIFKNQKLTYVRTIYKNEAIDSIYLFNLSKTDSVVSIRVYSNDSVSVYAISKKDELYGEHTFIFKFDNDRSLDFDFLSPILFPDSTIECQLTSYKKDSSKSVLSTIKQVDTLNLIGKLLNGSEIPVIKADSVRILKSTYDDDFTLLKYFGK